RSQRKTFFLSGNHPGHCAVRKRDSHRPVLFHRIFWNKPSSALSDRLARRNAVGACDGLTLLRRKNPVQSVVPQLPYNGIQIQGGKLTAGIENFTPYHRQGNVGTPGRIRSEEHTSELQS